MKEVYVKKEWVEAHALYSRNEREKVLEHAYSAIRRSIQVLIHT
jgi:hypothetical protein